MIPADIFKQGMRRFAAGVSVVTTTKGSVRAGLVATAVTSVTASPPTLLVCVNRSAFSHELITQAGIFCVNFLSDADGEIAERFSSAAFRHDRFGAGEWSTLETGAPALASALASFDCRVTQTITVSSHTIFIGAVAAVRIGVQEIAPLVYLNGEYLRPRIAS